MIALMVITAIISLVAFYLVMRFNLHMLQLNGYKNIEHFRWLCKNIKRQWTAMLLLICGVLTIFVRNVFVYAVDIICLLLVIVVFNFLRKHNVKKKLVYTARVKRLVITNVLLNGIILAVLVITPYSRFAIGVMMVLCGCQTFMLLLVNKINHPIEAAVNRYYINDAKRLLAQNKGMTIIGVTGSYGKTSVKFYLQTLLMAKYNVLVTPESFNTPMGVVRTIRESLKSTHEIFICEMGARHVGDIKEICDIVHPQHGVITSIGPQHLETFFNMDNIKNTKFELADALPKEGMLFLNGDNEYILEKAESYDKKIFYHADESDKGFYAKDLKVSQTGTDFTVVSPDGEECKYQMKLIGKHNVINVVGAIAVANSMGITLEELKIPVRRLQPVEHRMQMLERGQVTIIDDAYNSNPVGSKAAVETLSMFDGMRILVTPGMVELGAKEDDYNYKFGTYAANCCDYILLVGKRHTRPIMKGALDTGFDSEKCVAFDDLKSALDYAYGIRGDQHKFILLENDLPDNYNN